jgi:hypothetical protein
MPHGYCTLVCIVIKSLDFGFSMLRRRDVLILRISGWLQTCCFIFRREVAGSSETVTTHKTASLVTMEAAVFSETQVVTRLRGITTENTSVLISTTAETSDILIIKFAVGEVTASQWHVMTDSVWLQMVGHCMGKTD